MTRCKWCNLKNKLYVEYHDNEWGHLNLDEHHLYEMLILESFQAGLSWKCILNKRENFRKAFDDFDIDKVILYNDDDIYRLKENKGIIRNTSKIKSAINNSRIFKEIQKEFGSFKNYLEKFTNKNIYYENKLVKSELSDKISSDLTKRGMKYVGSIIIYSYLQAIGVINSHDDTCDFKNKKA